MPGMYLVRFVGRKEIFGRLFMRITVNKKLFLDQSLPIIDFDRISLAAYGGILSVASFGIRLISGYRHMSWIRDRPF